RGFSDVLFPNTGYTYLINLGTPFIMEVGEKKFNMKTDGFIPRHQALECYHRPGNQLFGIKFKISPVLFEKKINFSEYKGFVFPLSYLMESSVLESLKRCASFNERVKILCIYYGKILEKYADSLHPAEIVTGILAQCDKTNDFTVSIEDLARKNGISSRTLQRYFENTTSLSSKKALQVLRIRKAVEHLAHSPGNFDYSVYGYYDQSHFYKHLVSFLHKKTLRNLRPHLLLLQSLHS
ncbi:MAG TPA: AraC family transcriptional regulator, partial [Chitinophagaceae bacterium]|nr:AraC family transcriptional regulator [Chitinophagaceae bacterium]